MKKMVIITMLAVALIFGGLAASTNDTAEARPPIGG